MRVVTVSAKESFLFELLMTIQEEAVILETTDGQQFVVLSLDEWKGFDVGESDDFEQEVKATAENEELMAFLSRRRSNGKRIPMADVKKELGIADGGEN
jgi:hypothetical protein